MHFQEISHGISHLCTSNLKVSQAQRASNFAKVAPAMQCFLPISSHAEVQEQFTVGLIISKVYNFLFYSLYSLGALRNSRSITRHLYVLVHLYSSIKNVLCVHLTDVCPLPFIRFWSEEGQRNLFSAKRILHKALNTCW